MEGGGRGEFHRLELALITGYGPYANSRDVMVKRLCVQNNKFKPQLQHKRNTEKTNICPRGLPIVLVHLRSNGAVRRH